MSVLEELNGNITEYEYQKQQERKQERKRKRDAKIIQVLEDVKAEIKNLKGETTTGALKIVEAVEIIDRKIEEIKNESI